TAAGGAKRWDTAGGIGDGDGAGAAAERALGAGGTEPCGDVAGSARAAGPGAGGLLRRLRTVLARRSGGAAAAGPGSRWFVRAVPGARRGNAHPHSVLALAA